MDVITVFSRQGINAQVKPMVLSIPVKLFAEMEKPRLLLTQKNVMTETKLIMTGARTVPLMISTFALEPLKELRHLALTSVESMVGLRQLEKNATITTQSAQMDVTHV